MKIVEGTFEPGPLNDTIVTIFVAGDLYRIVKWGEGGKTWEVGPAEAHGVLLEIFPALATRTRQKESDPAYNRAATDRAAPRWNEQPA